MLDVVGLILMRVLLLLLQDFILEHYSEDGENYEEAIAELMETRQVNRYVFIKNSFRLYILKLVINLNVNLLS